MKIILTLPFLLLIIVSCSKSEDDSTSPSTESIYFPPKNSENWDTVSSTSLNWNQDKLIELDSFLINDNTKSFMILVNGKIAYEKYFNGHDVDETWQWNSAGKTLVTTTTGIAQQEGFLNIKNKVSDYLDTNWTSETVQQEDLIQPYHLLSMTSGLNDTSNLVIKSKMTYLADAGTRWSYSNVFQKLFDVVSESTGQEFRTYFNEKLESKIGMQGSWNYGLIFKIYHSDTRSMARYGLLCLNNGVWDNEVIINSSFYKQSITSSQEINPSYGYMWWLNGKSSYMQPGDQTVYNSDLVPNAPKDMYAAMGASEQRIYIVPSKNMVIIRMGNASKLGDSDFAVSNFDNALWEKLNSIFDN